MKFTTFTALTIAFATIGTFNNSARAEIIHFTNPTPGESGHYDWHFEPVEGWQCWLDITRAADEQTNKMNGNSISQWFESTFGVNHCGGGAQVLVDAPVGGGNWFHYVWAYATGEQLVEEPFKSQWGSAIFVYGDYSRFNEEHRYIGVRTQSGNRGWIEVVRDGMNLSAIAWAYETEPGVPIYAGQIPTPGPLALLAIGAFTSSTLSRRRRA
jgi:hypothetical protein